MRTRLTTNIETTRADGEVEMSEGSTDEGASNSRKVLKLHFIF